MDFTSFENFNFLNYISLNYIIIKIDALKIKSQVLGCLFEAMIILYKTTKINYKYQFKINQLYKDVIKKKTIK